MRRFIVVMLMLLSVAARADKADWIQWLAQLSSQGVDVSPKHWLVLSQNPSEQQTADIVKQYAQYIDTGRLNKNLFQSGWQIPDNPTDINQSLTPAFLSSIQPDIPQYKILMQALANLRQWQEVAESQFPDDLILFDGDQHPAVVRLNQWLEDLDLAEGLPEDAYSQQHKDALTSVQLQFDLMPDGRLGAQTRQALLAINNQRIRTIKANLERLRWLPRKLPYPHVRVDIPGFSVAYAKAPLQAHFFRAIIGSRKKQTPIFQDEIEGFTINPVWKVPHSIAARGMLRAEKKEPGFFRKEGFRVYKNWDDNAPELEPESVNWSKVSTASFRYRLEQQPGELNRLGRFKMNLPNSYGIYLHDTDKPELFEKKFRSLSSGCTRVSGIDGLIRRIANEQGLTDQLNEYLIEGGTRKLKLNTKIPIFFTYFTAWPDSSGRVRFRDDIYQLDRALTSWF